MSEQDYQHLLSPLKIGTFTVRNRAVFGAHGTGFATNGTVADRLIAYQMERARGGAGLVILEATGVDESPIGVTSVGRNLRNIDETVLPGYRRIADAVHGENTRVFVLLSHSGRNNMMGGDGTPPKAPSALSMDRTRDVPHELEIDEIEAIVQAFANAARRCRDGGLDGASISFAHGNLVQEFISPFANRRSDRYGGSEENRLRMAREVLQAARAAVGPDFALGIRFSAAELIPGGYTLEDGARFAPLFVEWGKLDFIDVTAGDNADMRSRSFHYPTISTPAMPLVPLARRIKEAVDVPVFAVGKIGDADEAEAIVARGDADMVVMVRAQIADPELVNKARDGRKDETRACIYCNESCFARQQRFGDISCVYNPRSGREGIWPRLERKTEGRKHVVVVGGGPAGLEAARTAAANGHRVELHERTAELGGQIRLLARTPHREGYLKIAEWLERQVVKHGVDIHRESRLDADAIIAKKPDAVVIATGSADTRPTVKGADLALTGRQVLAGANLGRRVVIGDWDGRHMAMSIAEKLATAGHEVEIVSKAFFVGMDADLLTWHPIYERLLSLGVRMAPMEEIVEIEPGRASILTLDRRTRVVEADTIVLCSRGNADRPLYRALKGRVPVLHAIGDCWAPRQLEQAILEGARVGREL